MIENDKRMTTSEAMRDAVISMAVESWRFGGVFMLYLNYPKTERGRLMQVESLLICNYGILFN